MKSIRQNQQDQQEVLVKKTTLNAIKKMLFGTTGTDLTNIINDVTMGAEDDLAAINVALAFKGFKPEFDTTPRFENSWRGYSKYEVLAVSLITSFARVRVTSYKYNKETDSFNVSGEQEQQVPYEQLLDLYYTDEEEVKQKAKE